MSEQQSAAERFTILVVDDYLRSAESLVRALRLENFTAFVALGGEEALRVFDEVRPRVVIFDLVSSPLDGFDLVRLIRSRPYGAKTLLIANIRWDTDQLRHECYDAGFDACLLNPIEFTELKKLLTWWSSPARNH